MKNGVVVRPQNGQKSPRLEKVENFGLLWRGATASSGISVQHELSTK